MLGRHYTESQNDRVYNNATALQQAATAIQQKAHDSLGEARKRLEGMMDCQGSVGEAMVCQFNTVCSDWMEQVRKLGNWKSLMSFIATASKTMYRAMVGEATRQGLRPVDSLAAVGQGPVM